MKWHVVSPYFETSEDQWISDAVNTNGHSFELVPRIGQDRNWHQSSSRAGFKEWLQRMSQARRAFGGDANGIITVFPQLAASAGFWKLLERSDMPILSWLFNTENLGAPHRRAVAQMTLRPVDRFVVHSTAEIEGYARVLKMPHERFEFVPLQYGARVETELPSGQTEPYVFATGSGYRDYKTFFEAIDKLGYRTLVLASDRVLDGLTIPSSVTILDQMTRPEIRKLVRHARVNVVPLSDEGVTAGLVTIVETFRHGRSLVTTNRPGLEDYIKPDENALSANLFDAPSMAEAIEEMWSNDQVRSDLDAAAAKFGDAFCTDEAAATHLVRLLDDIG